MTIAEGFTLGLVIGEGVFEATRGVSSAIADGDDTSVVGFVGITVGDEAGVEMGDDTADSIDRVSL